ncbi:hypothetical protein GQ54DRAFT_300531 [Martensiomyces pterosporus]|nr:hypothetical protein GQ54DRAFT_300531 [Martensiomyces pterosporus]
MDVGGETKWPNLCSYACSYNHYCLEDEDTFSCPDIIWQLDKELPKLHQASPVICEVPSGFMPLAYTPPSASFLTQLTSLCLICYNQGMDANRLPQFFAPTLVDLTLNGVNPENVWNIFYDGHENQTVVFARLKRLAMMFDSPLSWGEIDDLPPHLQDATNGALTGRSVWAAGAAGGRPGCRVPLFPVLRTLRCEGMAYNFQDFISGTQCHNSLVSLNVTNGNVYFDFDAKPFKTLETVEFSAWFRDTDEESTGSVDLYKSAFTSLLRAKTNIQRIAFRSDVCDKLFQVPPDIWCANLRSLCLGVEIDFKSMLRLLSNLKRLIELELDVDYAYIYEDDFRREDTAEDVDELQPLQVEYPPVSSTLRLFTCHLHAPKVRRCYTASYALELALHLPALESMTLGVDEQKDAAFFEALLVKLLQELSGSPHMNDGLLSAKVIQRSPNSWNRYL